MKQCDNAFIIVNNALTRIHMIASSVLYRPPLSIAFTPTIHICRCPSTSNHIPHFNYRPFRSATGCYTIEIEIRGLQDWNLNRSSCLSFPPELVCRDTGNYPEYLPFTTTLRFHHSSWRIHSWTEYIIDISLISANQERQTVPYQLIKMPTFSSPPPPFLPSPRLFITSSQYPQPPHPSSGHGANSLLQIPTACVREW